MSTGVKLSIWTAVFVVLIGIVLIAFPFVNVDAGERAVVLKWGAVAGTLDPGLHMLEPIAESAVVIDVRTQKEQADASAASLDLQTVDETVAVNYNVDPSKVGDLYTRVGTNYQTTVIDPAIQEVVKAVTANYNATDLIAERDQVSQKIQQGLVAQLQPYDIQVTNVSVVNFKFSDSFEAAIEAKVTASQNALASQNNLQAAKYDAEAIQVKSEAANNEKYIQLQQIAVEQAAVAKWDGHLPNQMIPGQSLPFLNLTANSGN